MGTPITVMTEEQADTILFEHTTCICAWFVTAGILDPLIVWRNGRIMLSYYRNEEKKTAQVRTIAKLQGKLQEVLAQRESVAKAKCDELLALLHCESIESEHTLTLYKGGSDNTAGKLVDAYGTDLRNFRGNSNAAQSCMNHAIKSALRHRDREGNKIYPCLAYNHSSLAIAVLTDNNTGEIVGRSIINLIHNQFYSVYTANTDLEPIMVTKLKQANFSQDGDGLKDCFLTTVINAEGLPMMPYLDGGNDRAAWPDIDDLEEGEEVAITYSRGYSCDHSSGIPQYYTSSAICDDCNDRVTEDEVYHIDGNCICGSCLDRNYMYAYTGHNQEYVHADSEALYRYGDEYYTLDGLEYHDLGVTNDGDVYSNDELIFTDSGTYHIDDCSECAITGETLPEGAMTKVNGLLLSEAAVKFHTTNGILNAIRDFIYCNGEPLEEDADGIIEAICHSDYEYDSRQTKAIHDAMLDQYNLDCELYRITQQLQLFAA